MKTKILQWGVEETESTLWIGPMRRDGKKLSDVVCSISINGLKPEAEKLARQRAHLIAQSVNHAGPQSDTIRELENALSWERTEWPKQIAQALGLDVQAMGCTPSMAACAVVQLIKKLNQRIDDMDGEIRSLQASEREYIKEMEG